MARALLDRQLTGKHAGRTEFALAAADDDVEIRRLLREQHTPGRIALSFEREPDYFFDAHVPGERKQTIVARESGRIVCLGSCVVRSRFVNGEARPVGYLGALRLAPACSGRFDIVRRGYEFFRELQSEAPADFYFTSIAVDNHRARRLLERGLPGMPRYEFIGEFVTSLLRTRSQRLARPHANPRIQIGDELVSRLNAHNRQFQFSPFWSEEELGYLANLGLRPQDFMRLEWQTQNPTGAAIWDQRAYKQTVIQGYAPALAAARPALNLAARMLGSPGLPVPGTVLSHAFVSHLQADPADPAACCDLIAALSDQAGKRGIELLTLGFASNDPRLPRVRRSFRGREYLTRLYVVHWPGLGHFASSLNAKILAPETALL